MTIPLSCFMSSCDTKHYYRITPQTIIGDQLFWNCREKNDSKIRIFSFSATGQRSLRSNFFIVNETYESNQHIIRYTQTECCVPSLIEIGEQLFLEAAMSFILQLRTLLRLRYCFQEG